MRWKGLETIYTVHMSFAPAIFSNRELHFTKVVRDVDYM
jgi:hypothetical protein